MFAFAHPAQSALRDAITSAYRQDETAAVAQVVQWAHMSDLEKQGAQQLARRLVSAVRAGRQKASGVDALMHEFSLSSEEGVALMCLAEALLRIPDKATQNKLIADKLSGGNWRAHLNHSPSLFVNAAAWGLLITGKLTTPTNEQSLSAAMTRMLGKGGEPLIRKGVDYAMRLLGKQFVTGQTIAEALSNAREREALGYRFSFDMLGEAAMTAEDAERYFQDYIAAIHAIGKDSANRDVYDSNGISVKLSAIHPRYSRAQHARVMHELLPRLMELFLLAKRYNIGLNIDAEEANRLELSLDLMEAVLNDPRLDGFNGIGFVVQAYQKRCPYVIDYLIDLARRTGHKLMIRLVKGAYWDSEIKMAQVDGLEGYPVYTRKAHTDVSYLACARKLLDAQDAVFPQFATHNALTLASVYQMGQDKDYEFQCLHGMGETLYDQVVGASHLGRRCRIYAPVGTHQTLLAYLVRRLLENGANSSFVNQIVDDNISIDSLIRSPLESVAQSGGKPHIALPLPRLLYGKERLNSQGVDLSNEHVLQGLQDGLNRAAATRFQGASVLAAGLEAGGATHPVRNPADHQDVVGSITFAPLAAVDGAVAAARAAVAEWSATPAAVRAECLRRCADLFEAHQDELLMLAVREAGKTLANAVAEVREAVDFCRYYAREAETTLADGAEARGVLVVISPWNFPLAIFTGQTIAALAAGNTVITKPAEQTGLIACRAVALMHEAGIPKAALQLMLGAGDVGAALTRHPDIAGVIFTGSTEVAQLINQTLAKRADLPVLIAETGGQNAMIVDSTALPEQVVADVVQSAFDSAGQRCSALRILCVQEEIADKILAMLKGAMDQLCVGNPKALSTDIGPVIDAEAQSQLLKHIDTLRGSAKAVYQTILPEHAFAGTFVPPTLIELADLGELKREVFGPVLHVVRYRAADLDALIDSINAKGYALTHGIHSRIDSTIEHICRRIEAGNIYVNRNIVGAVVGVQPFGGHNQSGTGPKAGGPFYLQALTRLPHWHRPALTRNGEVHHWLVEAHALVDEMGLTPEAADAANSVADAAAHVTLRHAEQRLSGPTGETNTLSWRAPHQVWLYGGTLAQAAQALLALASAGIRVVVQNSHPLAMWAEHLPRFLSVDAAPFRLPEIRHVVLLESADPQSKTLWAAREGALLKLVDAGAGIDVTRLMEETAVSINTTAAGGNASLMAMSETAL